MTDGGTLHLGIGDTLGANGDPITLNVGEGIALDFDAVPNSLGYWNQSGRNMTINLTGATMKNGNIHVFSASTNPTTINILGSSNTTEISTTLELRTSTGAAEDHLINVANGAAATDLLISGTVQGSSSNQYLVLTGGGTTKLTGNLENTITKMTLDGTTLQLGKDDSMSVKTNLYTSLSTGEGDETVVNNGTFDLNGHSTQLGYLSGSGQVINSGETTSVITLNNAWNSTFSGNRLGRREFRQDGAGQVVHYRRVRLEQYQLV